jgi:hypothetical protein
MINGLMAVPIDIQHIVASLTFDGATASGVGDATIDFIVGPGAGCPIFDLRQTITAVWLDGIPLSTADVALHDFGGVGGRAACHQCRPAGRIGAHAPRDVHVGNAAGVDGRELSAHDNVDGWSAARVQLWLHGPRTGSSLLIWSGSEMWLRDLFDTISLHPSGH